MYCRWRVNNSKWIILGVEWFIIRESSIPQVKLEFYYNNSHISFLFLCSFIFLFSMNDKWKKIRILCSVCLTTGSAWRLAHGDIGAIYDWRSTEVWFTDRAKTPMKSYTSPRYIIMFALQWWQWDHHMSPFFFFSYVVAKTRFRFGDDFRSLLFPADVILDPRPPSHFPACWQIVDILTRNHIYDARVTKNKWVSRKRENITIWNISTDNIRSDVQTNGRRVEMIRFRKI